MVLAGVQHIRFQKSPLRDCSGNRQKSTFMCHQRDRMSTQGGRSMQQLASQKTPAVLGNIGRGLEKERLSGDRWLQQDLSLVYKGTREADLQPGQLLHQTQHLECLNWVSLFLQCPDFCAARGELWKWLQPNAGLQNSIRTSLRNEIVPMLIVEC